MIMKIINSIDDFKKTHFDKLYQRLKSLMIEFIYLDKD